MEWNQRSGVPGRARDDDGGRLSGCGRVVGRVMFGVEYGLGRSPPQPVAPDLIRGPAACPAVTR
jgi:hypothetical protein